MKSHYAILSSGYVVLSPPPPPPLGVLKSTILLPTSPVIVKYLVSKLWLP